MDLLAAITQDVGLFLLKTLEQTDEAVVLIRLTVT